MSLCQDRQIKGFLLFLTLFALLFVGTATVLTIYQVNGAEALWLKHDEAVSSSLFACRRNIRFFLEKEAIVSTGRQNIAKLHQRGLLLSYTAEL